MNRKEEFKAYQAELDRLPENLEATITSAVKRAQLDTSKGKNKNYPIFNFGNALYKYKKQLVAVAVMILFIIGGFTVLRMVPEKSHDYISVVRIDGKSYELMYDYFPIEQNDNGILKGDELGTVEVYIPKAKYRSYKDTDIASTILEEGSKVYEWKGYSKEFRILGEGMDGKLYGFQRSDRNMPEGTKLVDLVTFSNNISTIILTDNYPRELGRITDPDTLKYLGEILDNEVTFVKEPDNWGELYSDGVRRFEIVLTDGTEVSGAWHEDSDFASLIGYVTLPKEFTNILSSHEVVSGREAINTAGGGLLYDLDYEYLYENLSMEWGADYTIWPMFINAVDGGIEMSPSLWFQERHQITDEIVKDIQSEGQNVWFLNADGDVVKLRYEYYGDESSMKQELDKGASAKSYITEEVVLNGPFIQLRVMDGRLYTLSSEWNLLENGTVIAEKVRAFELDGDSVVFADDKGIYRYKYTGEREILIETDTDVITSSGLYVYYSPREGGVYKLRINEAIPTKISDLTASRLIYSGADGKELGILEKGTGKLYVSSREEIQYLIRENVIDFGFYSSQIIVTVEQSKDGTDMARIWYSIEDTLHTDITLLSEY